MACLGEFLCASDDVRKFFLFLVEGFRNRLRVCAHGFTPGGVVEPVCLVDILPVE